MAVSAGARAWAADSSPVTHARCLPVITGTHPQGYAELVFHAGDHYSTYVPMSLDVPPSDTFLFSPQPHPTVWMCQTPKNVPMAPWHSCAPLHHQHLVLVLLGATGDVLLLVPGSGASSHLHKAAGSSHTSCPCPRSAGSISTEAPRRAHGAAWSEVLAAGVPRSLRQAPTSKLPSAQIQ